MKNIRNIEVFWDELNISTHPSPRYRVSFHFEDGSNLTGLYFFKEHLLRLYFVKSDYISFSEEERNRFKDFLNFSFVEHLKADFILNRFLFLQFPPFYGIYKQNANTPLKMEILSKVTSGFVQNHFKKLS